jgi:hypothetical protein
VLSNAVLVKVMLRSALNALMDITIRTVGTEEPCVTQRIASHVPPKTIAPLVRMKVNALSVRKTTSVTKRTTAFHATMKMILRHANEKKESTSKMRMATAESAALKYLAAPSAPTLKLAPNALLATTTHP